MQEPPIPPNETARLAALHALKILDTDPEERFARIVRLASALFRAPIALVSLVDAERQWFKAAHGLREQETPRCISFCGHAILQNETFVVEDATRDPRFCDNPLVTGEPHVRFYAGQPLAAADGSHIGTLCIIDREPRAFDAESIAQLRDLGYLIENELQHGHTRHLLESLRESESHSDLVVRRALDCIVSIDEHGTLLEFNPAAEHTFGYAAKDVIGRELASLIIPPALREAHRLGMAHFLKTGKGPVIGKRIEIDAMRADGSEFPVELAITPTHRAGKLTFTAHMRDVTERKNAISDLELQFKTSRMLAESEDPSVALVNILQAVCETFGASFGAIWRIDSGGQDLFCAELWSETGTEVERFASISSDMHFARGEDLLGRVWSSGAAAWIADVGKDPDYKRKAAANAAGCHASMCLPIVAQGETIGVLEFACRFVCEPDANKLRVFEAISNQIGQYLQRVDSKKRLLQATSELEAIFNLMPDGLITFNERGEQRYVNQSLLVMLGEEHSMLAKISEQDFERMLAQKSDPSAAYPSIADSGANEVAVIRLAIPRPMTLKRSVVTLHSTTSQSIDRLVYFRDITHEMEVDRMKTDFLSTAAHELRTPMASIHGFAELLLNREYDETTRRDLLDTIYRQSNYLIHMVNELLDLARIEARQGKDFHIAARALAPIIREAVKSFAMPNAEHKIVSKLGRRALVVAADAEKIHQALLNVLSNAAKYSAPGMPIELECRTRQKDDKDEVGIMVRDYGIGMTADQVARVFERFYRADTSGSVPGTGLGMSLVKEIVDIHHGEIEVASAPGKGTEVTIWLPRAEAASPRPRSTA